MFLKNCYLYGRDVNKDTFRVLQRDGEARLGTDTSSKASLFTQNILPLLDIDGQRRQRKENVHALIANIQHIQTNLWKLLFTEWPSGHTPFGVVLLCKDLETRSQLHEWLLNHRIYCPIHWMINEEVDIPDINLVKNISHRVLTIPVDQRYDLTDVSRVFALLLEFAAGGTL